MELLNYRPVGKAVLHRIAGLRKNRIEMISEVPSCCKDCPVQAEKSTWALFPNSYEYIKAHRACEKCPHAAECRIAETKQTKLYLNEKNKYGTDTSNGVRLKYTAIILWLTYHMLCSNEHGIIRNVSIKELADDIGCSQKAIRYNNTLLKENGYIDYVPGEYPGLMHVMINHYDTYFLEASAGGRGFYTLTQDVYHKLKQTNGTNQLRIVLKVLLDADNGLSGADVVQGYHDIHSYLPDYCKRNVIKRVVESISKTVCDVVTTNLYVRFRLDTSYDTKTIKKAQLDDNIRILRRDIGQICADIKKAVTNHLPPSFKNPIFDAEYKEHHPGLLVKLELTDKDYTNLGQISLDYTIEMVIHTLASVYFNILIKHEPIKSLGAVIRQQIKINTAKFEIL